MKEKPTKTKFSVPSELRFNALYQTLFHVVFHLAFVTLGPFIVVLTLTVSMIALIRSAANERDMHSSSGSWLLHRRTKAGDSSKPLVKVDDQQNCNNGIFVAISAIIKSNTLCPNRRMPFDCARTSRQSQSTVVSFSHDLNSKSHHAHATRSAHQIPRRAISASCAQYY